MAQLSWTIAEQGVKRLRAVGMPVCITRVQNTEQRSTPREVPEGPPHIKAVKNALATGALMLLCAVGQGSQ